ncbi:MAG TPA: hypothetical protein VKF35_15900 [Hyphomicrobiaceae bacterium]|nr:hypothetical protein [Hyphomicrobiaceae bacterium]
MASRGIRAQHGGSFLLARNLSALCDLTLKQARNARVHGGKVMSVTWISKSGVGSTMAAALVAMTIAAWPVASQAGHGHDGHGGGGGGGHGHVGGNFSGGHGGGGVRSGSSHFSGDRSFGFRAGGGHHRHFRNRNGVAFGFYDDGYGYGTSCEYYRQRALDTGRGYWWRRYRNCIEY